MMNRMFLEGQEAEMTAGVFIWRMSLNVSSLIFCPPNLRFHFTFLLGEPNVYFFIFWFPCTLKLAQFFQCYLSKEHYILWSACNKPLEEHCVPCSACIPFKPWKDCVAEPTVGGTEKGRKGIKLPLFH